MSVHGKYNHEFYSLNRNFNKFKNFFYSVKNSPSSNILEFIAHSLQLQINGDNGVTLSLTPKDQSIITKNK